MKNNPFAFVLDQIENNLPEGLRPLKNEVKETVRGFLDEKIAQLDYVPRAEFEAQLALLASAEARIQALEDKIARLEAGKNSTPELLPAPKDK